MSLHAPYTLHDAMMKWMQEESGRIVQVFEQKVQRIHKLNDERLKMIPFTLDELNLAMHDLVRGMSAITEMGFDRYPEGIMEWYLNVVWGWQSIFELLSDINMMEFGGEEFIRIHHHKERSIVPDHLVAIHKRWRKAFETIQHLLDHTVRPFIHGNMAFNTLYALLMIGFRAEDLSRECGYAT